MVRDIGSTWKGRSYSINSEPPAINRGSLPDCRDMDHEDIGKIRKTSGGLTLTITKKSINKLRQKDFLLTILALAFLFFGIPAYVSLLNNWNTNIANPGDYQRMEQEDFGNYTVYDPDTEYEGIHSIFTWHNDLIEQSSIVWSENTTTNHTMVVEGENNQYGPWWVTPWRISDLITNGTLSFQIRLKLPSDPAGIVKFIIYYVDEIDNKIQLVNPTSSRTLCSKTLTKNSFDVYVNTTTIDLMVDKAEMGNDRIIFFLSTDEFDDVLDTGDILEFDFYYYQPDETQIDENKALKWGGGVAGFVCILIGIGSTSLWNPFDKKRPGWIDIQIKKLLNRRKK